MTVIDILIAAGVEGKIGGKVAVGNGGGIRNRDVHVHSFVAIGCQRGGYVSHNRAVLAVKLSNWEYLSAQEIESIEDQIM